VCLLFLLLLLLPQREKKTLKPIVQDGKVVSLTSHTLAPGQHASWQASGAGGRAWGSPSYYACAAYEPA
jgi:hypothetical protein